MKFVGKHKYKKAESVMSDSRLVRKWFIRATHWLYFYRFNKNNVWIYLEADEHFSLITSSSLSSSTPKSKRRKLFTYDNENNEDSTGSTSTDAADELEAYLSDPVRSKFSDYWLNTRLHTLKSLVVRIFSVQASSAPIERVFS